MNFDFLGHYTPFDRLGHIFAKNGQKENVKNEQSVPDS